MGKILARGWLGITRWRCVAPQHPVPKRCVVIAFPHTSNWDFPLTLALAAMSGVPLKWLGKRQLFRGPMGPIMRSLGGVSVERSSKQGMVAQWAAEFGSRDQLALLVAAEGTRSRVEYWKSGFYRLAQEAGVPIACAFVDGATKTGGFGLILEPSGDIKADMDRIRAFYADKKGWKPELSSVPRMKEEDAVAQPMELT
jgi:1-acyl-sn-glycerol-3-phosphate acyltransferase